MSEQGGKKQVETLAKAYCHKHIRLYNRIVADPVVAVKAKVDCGGTTFYGAGGARCCHLDVFDEERGLVIATGRAVVVIAEQLVEADLSPWEGV